MCGTNKKIELGNTSVIERNAYAMQISAVCTTVASSLCRVSNRKDRWVTAAIIIFTIITIFATIWHLHHYHQLKKCQRLKQNAQKILMTIVYINLLKLVVKLMKIRISIADKYFSKRKKSLLKKQARLFFLQSPHCGQVGQNSESSSAQLSPSTSPYPTSLRTVKYSNKTYKKSLIIIVCLTSS